jgi:hypothetical protein
MQDIDLMVTQIIAMLNSNASLLALLDSSPVESPFNPTNAPIFAYLPDDAKSTSLEDAIQQQPAGTIMVCWERTDTTKSRGMETYEHSFLAYVMPQGSLSAIFTAFMNGACTLANNYPFRMSTVNPNCLPPTDLSCGRRTVIIGQGQLQFDCIAMAFSLVERGADT